MLLMPLAWRDIVVDECCWAMWTWLKNSWTMLHLKSNMSLSRLNISFNPDDKPSSYLKHLMWIQTISSISNCFPNGIINFPISSTSTNNLLTIKLLLSNSTRFRAMMKIAVSFNSHFCRISLLRLNFNEPYDTSLRCAMVLCSPLSHQLI